MIATGHWIGVAVWANGAAIVNHYATLAEAWHYRDRATPAIISRCPAPGSEECNDCWLTEVPF